MLHVYACSKGSQGGPKEWVSQVTTGLIVFCSQFFMFQTLVLTDVQIPFLGTPLVPLQVMMMSQADDNRSNEQWRWCYVCMHVIAVAIVIAITIVAVISRVGARATHISCMRATKWHTWCRQKAQRFIAHLTTQWFWVRAAAIVPSAKKYTTTHSL